MNQQEISRKISDSFDGAKAGNALNLYGEICQLLAGELPPLKSHYAFGWIIYYALHQSPAAAIAERRRMLGLYFRLQLTKPHKLHSMILTEAVRVARDASAAQAWPRCKQPAETFSFSKFIDLWDPRNLRPGDWARKEFEGKQTSSLAEKVITRYADDLNSAPSASMMAVVDQALTQFADSPMLKSQASRLYLLAGDRARADLLAREAAILAPGKFFLWSRLAELIDRKANPRLYFALIGKALSAPGPEEYKSGILIDATGALIETATYPQALYLFNRLKALYQKQGWHEPRQFQRLRDAIPQGTQPSDPAPIFHRLQPLADQYVYQSLPAVEVRKTYHKPAAPAAGNPAAGPAGNSASATASMRIFRSSLPAWRVTDAAGRNYWLTPSRFAIDPQLPLGTRLQIRLLADRPVAATLIP